MTLRLLILPTLIAFIVFSSLANAQTPVVTHQEPPADSPEAVTGTELIDSIKLGDLPEVARVLFAGTDPDATDDDGYRPLCWAVRMNRSDIVELLLEKGADVNAEEHDEGTALDVAATAGHPDLVRLLLARGALPDHKDHGGHSALIRTAMGAMVADVPESVLQVIWGGDEKEASKALFANLGREHRAVMELLLDAGADANLQAEDCGLTALMIAAIGGRVELVQTLLKHGAKVDAKDDTGNALQMAENLDSPEGVAELLNGESEQTATAWLSLVRLTAPGRREVAKLLRAAGAQE